MAQNESTLWTILRLMRGNRTGWTSTILDKEPLHHDFEDAYSVGKLKGELVLRYRPEDIEDTIYFMKHRGYFEIHGQGMIAPEMVFSLTEKARNVLDRDCLPEDEEKAFQEAMWDIRPRWWGMGPNLSEWRRRMKKLARRRFSKNPTPAP